jgi:ElaB/YqjD/DUF883 family membrane-anchored ribosome-binding protein
VGTALAAFAHPASAASCAPAAYLRDMFAWLGNFGIAPWLVSRTPQREKRNMDQDRGTGTVHNLGGKVEDAKSTAQSLADQALDKMHDAYDEAADVAERGAAVVKDAAVGAHDTLKRFIEDNPHTATLIAMGVGVLIGYAAHRPPPRRSWWD